MKYNYKNRPMLMCIALLGLTVGLSGCAVESIPYPTLSTATKLKNKILSREEQQEVILDLSTEQQKHQSSAIDTIEKTQ